MSETEIKKDNQENILENIDLQEALKYNRFHHLLRKYKKYRFIYWSKQALLSLIITITITALMRMVAIESIEEANVLSRTLITAFISGMLTILALSLTGLAIIVSSFSEKFLTIVIRESKLNSFVSILFNFYFAGFVIGVSVLLLTISYIVLSISMPFSLGLYSFLIFTTTYSVFFSIIFSIMLLGTCIRMFLVKYAVEKKFTTDKK